MKAFVDFSMPQPMTNAVCYMARFGSNKATGLAVPTFFGRVDLSPM